MGLMGAIVRDEIVDSVMGRVKWAPVATSSDFKFDFNSPAHPDIYAVDWTSCSGVHKSSSGSTGVYLVSSPSGAVVVKGSASLGSLMFANRLAERLGIRTPKTRIVSRATLEGTVIYDKLVELNDREPIARTARQGLLHKYLIVMEFCSGARPMSLLEDSHFGARVMEQIGEIVAFDMFCHNTDRIPCIVSNRGNPGNLLFDSLGPIAIDSLCCCPDIITHRELAFTYLENLCRLLRTLSRRPDEVVSFGISQVIATLRLYCPNVEFLDEHALDIQRGILSFCSRIDELTLENLKGIYISIVEECGFSAPVGFEAVRLDFLELCLKTFQSRGNLELHL